MKKKRLFLFVMVIFLFSICITAQAQNNAAASKYGSAVNQPLSKFHGVPHQDNFIYGDPRADAPDLAYRGSFDVGVRTLEVVNPDQIDISNYSEDNPEPRYDRPLTQCGILPSAVVANPRSLPIAMYWAAAPAIRIAH